MKHIHVPINCMEKIRTSAQQARSVLIEVLFELSYVDDDDENSLARERKNRLIRALHEVDTITQTSGHLIQCNTKAGE